MGRVVAFCPKFLPCRSLPTERGGEGGREGGGEGERGSIGALMRVLGHRHVSLVFYKQSEVYWHTSF